MKIKKPIPRNPKKVLKRGTYDMICIATNSKSKRKSKNDY